MVVLPFYRFGNTKSAVNFVMFCECPESGLNETLRGNTSLEIPALELFWGNPNGQFLLNVVETPEQILQKIYSGAPLLFLFSFKDRLLVAVKSATQDNKYRRNTGEILEAL